MLVWILPVYIISGIGLTIAGYLSYKHKPYCFQNQAIRNEAIRIHRIKLRQFDLGSKEQLTPEDEKQYEIFRQADKKDTFIDYMLDLFVAVHLICLMIFMIPSSNWGELVPLYYISGLLILIGKPVLLSVGNFKKPLCITNQSFYDLDIIESFYKQINGQTLNDEDKKHIKNYETEIRWNRYHMNVLYMGIVLHLIANLFHGILVIYFDTIT